VRYYVRFAKWKAEGRRYFEHDNIMFQTLVNRVRSDVVGTDGQMTPGILLMRGNIVERLRAA
jgi:hypothetical protein